MNVIRFILALFTGQDRTYGSKQANWVKNLLAHAAELLGKKVSNYSARRTCIETLRQENIDNLNNAGLSGHHNVLSLHDYSTISEEQQKEIAYMISKRLVQSGCSFNFRIQ